MSNRSFSGRRDCPVPAALFSAHRVGLADVLRPRRLVLGAQFWTPRAQFWRRLSVLLSSGDVLSSHQFSSASGKSQFWTPMNSQSVLDTHEFPGRQFWTPMNSLCSVLRTPDSVLDTHESNPASLADTQQPNASATRSRTANLRSCRCGLQLWRAAAVDTHRLNRRIWTSLDTQHPVHPQQPSSRRRTDPGRAQNARSVRALGSELESTIHPRAPLPCIIRADTAVRGPTP